MGVLENCYSASLTATATTTGGAVYSLLNPFGEDVIITSCVIDIETPGTAGGAELNVGIAASATTESDNLLDGVEVGTGIAVATAYQNPEGMNGKGAQRWDSTEYLTATCSASTLGMVGEIKFQIIRI